MSQTSKLRSALDVITKQYAFRRHLKTGERCFTAGGMPHLEAAFNVLGWDDPLVVKTDGCAAEGCEEWATIDFYQEPTKKHWRLCSKHYWNGFTPKATVNSTDSLASNTA